MAHEKPAPHKKVLDITTTAPTAPAATSRPLVGNRPVLTKDPMMAPVDAVNPAGTEPVATAPIVSRQAKTIVPVSGDMQPQPAQAASAPEAGPEEVPVDTTPATDPDTTVSAVSPDLTVEADRPAPASEQTEVAVAATGSNPAASDDAAAIREAEAAESRRRELEKLAASGRYNVPINAVERKRSQYISVALTVLIVLLSLVLIDLMLDANVIELIQKIPHTHFFRAS